MKEPTTNSTEGPEAFTGDKPLTDPKLDRFKRDLFARRIATTVALRKDPTSIVVLIHGAWGEGKTTVLEFIEQELKTHPKVIAVRFNPWRITDETTLLMAFFATIAKALDESPKGLKERVGDAFRKYGDIAGEFSCEYHGTKLSAGQAPKKVGEMLSMVTLDEKRTRIEQLLNKHGIRIVVFLDDIDRLDRKGTQTVFKLLKLSANFDNVSYILAFDRDVVAAAISEQYGAGDHRAGYDYLEKIVQVNLNLPLADRDALATFCLELLKDAKASTGVHLSDEQEKEFHLVFLQDIAPGLRTPRVAKLYANAVAFIFPLLADEVNPVDLLLLEAIKIFHPSLHELIRQSPGTFTRNFGLEIEKMLYAQAFVRFHDESQRNPGGRSEA